MWGRASFPHPPRWGAASGPRLHNPLEGLASVQRGNGVNCHAGAGGGMRFTQARHRCQKRRAYIDRGGHAGGRGCLEQPRCRNGPQCVTFGENCLGACTRTQNNNRSSSSKLSPQGHRAVELRGEPCTASAGCRVRRAVCGAWMRLSTRGAVARPRGQLATPTPHPRPGNRRKCPARCLL